jgi:ankyrin repeat protein
MTPLHLACASQTPNFHENMTALLDFFVESMHPDFYEKQLSVQDDQGRSPFQLLPANDSFLLHQLSANSLHLSEKAVRLLVDMFPNSITTPNKYGMLPFHCACLNPKSTIEMLMLFFSMSPEVVVPIQPSPYVLMKENIVVVKKRRLK